MNVSDIGQVIRCNYIIEVEMHRLIDQLNRYDEEYSLNINPNFQRDLVWSLENKVKFVEFVLKGGTAPPIVFNCPVFGGRINKGDMSDEMVVVDGKQRLSALISFLNGELRVFGGNSIKDILGIEPLLRRLSINFKVNHISSRKDLLTWYLEMNEGQIAHSKEEIEKVKLMLKGEL